MTGANGSVVPVVLPISPALCRPFRVMCMPSEGILFSSIWVHGQRRSNNSGGPTGPHQTGNPLSLGRQDQADFGSLSCFFVYSGFAYSRLGNNSNLFPGTLYTYLDKDTTSYTISLNGKTVKPEVRNGYGPSPRRLAG